MEILGRSIMEKKVKDVKAAMTLIIEEDVTAIKQIINNFAKKTSKDSFINKKEKEGVNKAGKSQPGETVT